MKRIKVAIVTDDSAYGEALIRGLRYRSKAFLTTRHSIGEFIHVWKKEGIACRKSYDLILWDGEEGERIRGENIIWLTDRTPEAHCGLTDRIPEYQHGKCSGSTEPGSGDDHILYRYETASRIHSRLIDVLEKNDPEALAEVAEDRAVTDTRVIAFGSWRGGAGCTTLCRATGQELTRFFGKRVLWLSLDGIEPEVDAGRKDQEGSCADGVDRFLYSILGRESGKGWNLNQELERFLIRDGYGLARLRPSMGRNPLPHLGPGDAAKVIGAIVGSGSFDALLIDAGTCTSDGAAEMIAFADRICLRGKGKEESKNRYMRWIGNAIGTAEEGPGGTENKNRMIMAEDIPEAECDEEILLEGEFGKYIHAQTEALWYNEIEQIA